MDTQKTLFFLASTPHELPFAPSHLKKKSLSDNRPFRLDCPSKIPVSGFLLGVGSESAQKRLNFLEAFCSKENLSPSLVLFGFSGATSTKWPAATVFVPHYFESALMRWPALARALKSIPLLKSLQVDSVVNKDEDRSKLLAQHDAFAVDMESLTVHEWAQSKKIPCVAVRSIFDLPGHSLGSFEELLTTESSLNVVGLVKNYALQPTSLLRLWRLSTRCKEALTATASTILASLENE